MTGQVNYSTSTPTYVTGPVPPPRGVINGAYGAPQPRSYYGGSGPSVPTSMNFPSQNMNPAGRNPTMGSTIPMSQTQPFMTQPSVTQPSMNQPLMNQATMPQPATNQQMGMNPAGFMPGGANPLPPPVSSYDPNRYFDQHPTVGRSSTPTPVQKGSIAQQRLVSTNQNPSITQDPSTIQNPPTIQSKPGSTKVKKEKKEFYDVEVEKGSR